MGSAPYRNAMGISFQALGKDSDLNMNMMCHMTNDALLFDIRYNGNVSVFFPISAGILVSL